MYFKNTGKIKKIYSSLSLFLEQNPVGFQSLWIGILCNILLSLKYFRCYKWKFLRKYNNVEEDVGKRYCFFCCCWKCKMLQLLVEDNLVSIISPHSYTSRTFLLQIYQLIHMTCLQDYLLKFVNIKRLEATKIS